jgi:hypothetical protein
LSVQYSMLLDWSNPPRLSCPRLKRKRLEMAAADKAVVAIPRKGRKNHSVNRERSREMKAKAETLAAQSEARSRYLAAVRAFWRGERAEHP